MRRKCYFEFLHDSNFNPDPLLGIHIYGAAVQKPASESAGRTCKYCRVPGGRVGAHIRDTRVVPDLSRLGGRTRVLGDCIFCINSDAFQNTLIYTNKP